jgi:putative ABC transport system permease protein
MISCILILLYVQYELNYDKFHRKAKRIYRVIEERKYTEVPRHFATSYAPISILLNKDFPEIKTVRFSIYQGFVSVDKKKQFEELRFFYIDSTVFQVFDFKLLIGNPLTVLNNPFSVVLTLPMAKKYFGNENPMGKIIYLDNKLPFQVTGIMEAPPENSHIKFDFLASFSTITQILGHAAESREAWWAPQIYTYLLFPEKYDIKQFGKKFPDYINQYINKWMGDKRIFTIQPITNIHLKSNLENEVEANSSIAYIYIFSAVAFFILLIACLNFMNLTTAKSAKRAKEVALRKVVGAPRRQLITQFISESTLFAIVAMAISIASIELILPFFNILIGKELAINKLNPFLFLLSMVGGTLVVGFIAGSYPAFYLSNTRPIETMKGERKVTKNNANVRKILIIIQFIISTVLICFTLLVSKQLRFLQTTNLGFRKEHIIVIPIIDKTCKSKADVIKAEFYENKDILKVTASGGVPGRPNNSEFPYKIESTPEEGSLPNILTFAVDYEFVETYQLQIIEGRNFSKEYGTDDAKAFILNETAIRTFGWKTGLGRKFTLMQFNGQTMENKEGTIIGVIKDFHYKSLHYNIEPLVIEISPSTVFYNSLSVRINAENVKESITYMETKWKKIFPERPFEYFFLDDNLEMQYKSEGKLRDLINYFSILAIIIACLGLFGLATFTAEQRTKEIGIRKAMGASVTEIVILLTKEFTKWVLIANIISWPVAWLVMNKWLQDFAYRTNIDIYIFLISTLSAFIISIITVTYQAVKAAGSNPVEALKYE